MIQRRRIAVKRIPDRLSRITDHLKTPLRTSRLNPSSNFQNSFPENDNQSVIVDGAERRWRSKLANHLKILKALTAYRA